jgi:hypothetical protein
MRWCMLFLALVVTTFLLCSVVSAAAPPGVLRWDTQPFNEPYKATAGPAPSVYQLSVPMATPQAVEADDFGRCYVLDHNRQCISRFTPSGEVDKLWLEDTGHSCRGGTYDISLVSGERIYLASDHWLPVVRRFGPDPEVIENLDGVDPARCIAAAEDGAYYLYQSATAEGTSRILAYSAAGKLVRNWDTPSLSCMNAGPDGLLYAVKSDEPRAIVYNKLGQEQRQVDLAALEHGFAFNLRFAIDRNGDMYFSTGMYIVRLDSSGKPLARWLPYQEKDSSMPPRAGFYDVAVKNGIVYALHKPNSYNPEIQSFTPDGQCIARYIPLKPDIELPWAVAAQSDGSYIVEQALARDVGSQILAFDPSGRQSGEMSELASHAWDVAPRRDGGYYIAQLDKLVRTDASGRNPVVIAETGDRKITFNGVRSDMETGRLWALVRAEGYELWSFGPDEALAGRVQISKDADLSPYEVFMAVDPKGAVYLSDTPKHHILKCDFEGRVIGTIGKLGNGLGELRRPKGLFVDSEGRLIVADTRNCRIQAFSRDGEPLGVWGRMGTGRGELNCPTGVTVAPNGYVIIADTHNDRVVRVSAADFWTQLRKDAKPAQVQLPKPERIPVPGLVTVIGMVIAGTDDLTDAIYVESPDRAWGLRVTLPAGTKLPRGCKCRIRGSLELIERDARHVVATTVENLPELEQVPAPLGMANLYVGDGYRRRNEAVGLSNLGLLVKTWGRVVSVDPQNETFVINDGSLTRVGAGLIVYAGQMTAEMAAWPGVGQYVIATGVATSRAAADGTFRPAVRMRTPNDLEIMVE